MSLLGFIRFVVNCFDVLAWPVLGFVYPLCASIWTIETNSVSDTQKLNTYWVVFSLILLLEHALNFLECFWCWHYIRLIIVISLSIPYFDGAFYVYKQVIRPCLSVDPGIVLNWFAKPKKCSTESENFIAEVEKYVKQNGTEALKKIISSKCGNSKNLEVVQPNSEEKTKPTGVKEKNIVATDIQDSEAKPKAAETENRTSISTETQRKVSEVTVEKELAQRPANLTIVQKELICEMCCVVVNCTADFISHLQGKKCKAMYELKKASKSTNKPTALPGNVASGVKSDERKKKVQKKNQNKDKVVGVDSFLWCTVCDIQCTGKSNMESHLRGKKHLKKLK